ncbi:MAG: GatB/YqeY domain-containing protein [Candidatus Magasanikbacteria bacterium]|nr:GatB/YqeY domain-containing protein [Candidatus Magasanikbacteria bacterium]
MNLREKIEQDFLEAFKKRESRLSVLRLLKAALQNALVEKRVKEGRVDVEVLEEEIITVVRRMVRQTKDALVDFEKAGRRDLTEQAKEEIKTLEGYLPGALSEEEIKKIIEETATELKAGAAEAGKVIGLVMKKAGGRAEGVRVKELVEQRLKKG